MYLSGNRRVDEAVVPDGKCTPILHVPSLFYVVLGGTKLVYDIGLGKESLGHF